MSAVTAILVFAQPVAYDAAGKYLSVQADVNRRAIQLLNERVRQTACQTGLPVLLSTDLISHSGSFGEQVSAALQAAFGRGFEQVLVVGNDCPALTVADLNRASVELQSGKVVIGPDTRGGLYLLGLSRHQFDADALAQLPWQTAHLQRVIQAYFAAHPVLPLRALGDINRAADVKAFRITSSDLQLFMSVLLHLINGWAIRCRRWVSCRAVQPSIYRTGSLRAPPTPAFLPIC